MARLKDLSALTALELLRSRNRSLRCHPIDWKNTSESGFGIKNEEQLVDTPYQFSLSSNTVEFMAFSLMKFFMLFG